MDSAEERKRALERKKQKLAEMREEKRRREDERRQTLLPTSSTPSRSKSPARLGLEQTADINVDELLAGVGIPANQQRLTSANTEYSPMKSRQATSAPLTISKTVQMDIVEKKGAGNTYEKSVQAELDIAGGKEFQGVGSLDFEEDDMLGGGGNRLSQEFDEFMSSDESPTHQLAKLGIQMPQINNVLPAGELGGDKTEVDKKRKRPTDLTTEQKEELLINNDFLDFFERAHKVLERGLEDSKRNIFIDYASTCDPSEQLNLDEEVKLTLECTYFHEGLNLRNITSLDIDTEKRPELFAASYRESTAVLASSTQGKNGIVCVWNLNFSNETPEYQFYSHSPVTSVSFAKFHPNLLLGGTISGRVLLWDNRVHKRTPVQRSSLSSKTHTLPIFSTQVIGSATAPHLISVSSEGKMCAWSLDMLTQPIERIELTYAADSSSTAKSVAVPVTCASFPVNSFNYFYVGAEDGNIYAGQRHGDTNPSGLFYGQKEGQLKENSFNHSTFVSAIDCHRVDSANQSREGEKTPTSYDFSHLYLSSSFDWTVKLWSGANHTQPLHTFDTFREYVMDVKWSPTHPSVFACIDSSSLQVWNIADDTENPVIYQKIEDAGSLNRIQWTHNGQRLLVADTRGSIFQFGVADSLFKPETNDWEKLQNRLNDIQQQHEDVAEIQKTMNTIVSTSSLQMTGVDRSISAY